MHHWQFSKLEATGHTVSRSSDRKAFALKLYTSDVVSHWRGRVCVCPDCRYDDLVQPLVLPDIRYLILAHCR